jgi:hypothetical protein
MANSAQVKRLLRQSVEVWNAWRAKKPSVDIDLSGANLDRAYLWQANLSGANFEGAYLFQTNLSGANLSGANLSRAHLSGAYLWQANLTRANLSGANLHAANLSGADLSDVNLIGANLIAANLSEANLTRANLTRANLSGALLVQTNLVEATLTDCLIYGISAWNTELSAGTIQHGLIITSPDEPAVTVDDLEVAQFVYLLLHNEKIRRIIDTVGRKGVLLLGRFTEGRIEVLERLREELRKRDYVPIVSNFDKPETKDFTETVRLLAGLSKFVIADLSSPKSVPYELGTIVSQTMIPFQPIIEAGETPFAMLEDLRRKYKWVLKTRSYSSLDRLIETMDDKIIKHAEAKSKWLLKRLKSS